MAEYLPPEVSTILDLVDNYLLYEKDQEPPRGHERFHPSAFGQCLRKMQYQRYEEMGFLPPIRHQPIEPFLCRIFGTGHAMHDRWRSYFEGLGILRGYWQCMNPFCSAFHDDGTIEDVTAKDLVADPTHWLNSRRMHGKDELQGCFKPEKCICGWTKFHYHEVDVVDKELNFYGHCDIILDFSRFDEKFWDEFSKKTSLFMNFKHLPKKPIVIDMKTINHFKFQDVAKNNPHSYYVVQLTIYANLLDCEYGVLIYENKNNSRTCAFRIDRNEDSVMEEVRGQALEMIKMTNVMDDDGDIVHLLPPPRPLSSECDDCSKYCDYYGLCSSSGVWEDPLLELKRIEFYGALLDESH